MRFRFCPTTKSFWVIALFLAGCASSPPAPVIDRMPEAKKPAPAKPPAAKAGPAAPGTEKDWRPDVYTVKKGDTLFGIGLEYGYDYKEIAQANNIPQPYVIRIGQQLKLKDLKAVAAPDSKTAGDSNVVISPLKTDADVSAPGSTPTAPAIPTLSEPKAIREPYSVQAMAEPLAKSKADVSQKPAEVAKTTEPAKADATKIDNTAKADVTKPDTAKPDTPDTVASDDETVDWAWPTNGKVLAGFNDAGSARGIDIAGAQGQAVLAAAPGKVIYSGADLRGYGKLVIIKHNKTYLSVYAHNSQILVKEGQQVVKGQKIAEMGSSDTDRVKLHFEIRRQGKSVDPSKYLSGNPG
ncbi:MAG TPA: peptidoglycan DD-metalloendopeptidase family protein [Methylophilaceae bacterium]|nr:peptidoglycan DD-metalloendopeptidase family protein [Methylophilaceae bacterium]